MHYERQTRDAYKSRERAAAYKTYHTRRWSWGRIATALEQRLVRRLLRRCACTGADTVLDAPCGTGILGRAFAALPATVVASDISFEMMEVARSAYAAKQLRGFVQADITATPFADGEFAAVLTLGFMHRVPEHVRRATLSELHRITSRFLLVSFSLSSPGQRLKHRVISALAPGHVPAPHAIPRAQAEREIREAGFHITAQGGVAPVLSAESLYLLAKEPRSREAGGSG